MEFMEKLVLNRLYDFLEVHKLLYEHQYVFWNKDSTDHVLIDIPEKIKSVLDQNMFACGIFIDLQKAFDTVNYNILLHKLDHYGIMGLPNKLFQSFLSGRSQYTSIKDKSSNKLPITHGVPQGSVLEPLLFILYISHLNKASKTEIILFKHKQTIITEHLNFRVSGQKINTTTSVKHLGLYLKDFII